jgi:hypothetical protein
MVINHRYPHMYSTRSDLHPDESQSVAPRTSQPSLQGPLVQQTDHKDYLFSTHQSIGLFSLAADHKRKDQEGLSRTSAQE